MSLEEDEVLPRMAFPTNLLKEKWPSSSLLDEGARRVTLPRSQCFGDSSMVVNDMDFKKIEELKGRRVVVVVRKRMR